MAVPASMTVLGWSDINFTPISFFSTIEPPTVPAIAEQVGRVLSFVPKPPSSAFPPESIFHKISSYLDRPGDQHQHHKSEPLPSISLLSTGCRVPSNPQYENFAGRQSCSYACGSGPLSLQDTATIWNCAVLSAATLLSQAEIIRLDPESRRRVNRSPLDAHYGPMAEWDLYHKATKMAGQDGVMEEDLNDVEGGWEFYGIFPHTFLMNLIGHVSWPCKQEIWPSQSGNPRVGLGSPEARMALAPLDCSPEVVRDIRTIYAWTQNTTGPRENISPNTVLEVVGSLSSLLTSYCDGAPKPTGTSDLAGPGILISVAIQTGLWLILFVPLRILTSWTTIVSFPFYAIKALRVPYNEKPFASAWTRARSLQTRLATTRLARSLIPAAMDLHETQLFITLALQTAVIVANTMPVSKFERPQTYFYANHLIDSLAKVLTGMNSTLPVLLASLLFYGNSQKQPLPSRRPGFHTLCMVFLAAGIAFGLAPAILMTTPTPEPVPPVFVHAGSYNQPGLFAHCGLEKLQGTGPGQGLRGVLFYAIGTAYPVVPALLLQLLVTYLVSRGRSDGELRRLGVYGVGLAGVLKRKAEERKDKVWILCWKTWVGIVEVVWAIMELGVAFFAALNFVEIVRLLTVIELGQKVWTAGQIVAMGAVWGPGLWRLINVVIFGIEKAAEPRLPSDHEVVKFDAGAMEEDDDDLDLFGGETGSPLLGPEDLDDEDLAMLGPSPIMLSEEDLRRDEFTDD